MALTLATSSVLGYARAPAPSMMARGRGKSAGGVAELEELAAGQRIPGLSEGIWDPLGFTKINLFDFGEEGSVGWLRHAEIKHGRVAMFGFVGYIVHANHIVFPWAITGGPLSEKAGGAVTMFSDISAAGSPVDQWQAVPTAGKVQILLTIALLEYVGETTSKGKPHYTKGGLPGYVPPIKEFPGVPHPIPFNLYDPFELFSGADEATKARGRNVEINNGRAAMLGIFGFLAEAKIPGSVPVLTKIGIPAYAGNIMAPFEGNFHLGA